jgi:hypothetical protein
MEVVGIMRPCCHNFTPLLLEEKQLNVPNPLTGMIVFIASTANDKLSQV